MPALRMMNLQKWEAAKAIALQLSLIVRSPIPQRCKDSLRNALNVNDRIQRLARNPLLLTIIALIHRYQADLPKQRYKLYERAVETLLTAWDKNKELRSGIDALWDLVERLFPPA